MKIKAACYTASKRLRDGSLQQQSVSISRGSCEHTGLPEVIVLVEGSVVARFDGDSLLLWKEGRGNTSFTQDDLENLSRLLCGEGPSQAVYFGKLLVDFI